MKPGAQVPVSKRALVQRVSRRLTVGRKLVAAADGWVVVDVQRGAVVHACVDLDELESYARGIGALESYETVTK